MEEMIKYILLKSSNYPNFAGINLGVESLSLILKEVENNKNIYCINWGKNNENVLNENRDLKMNILNQLVENLIVNSHMVIDLSEYDYDNDYLACLERKINNSAIIGGIIWNHIESDDHGETKKRIEKKLAVNNLSFKKFPSDYVHLLLACHCRSLSDELWDTIKSIGWQIADSFQYEIGAHKRIINVIVPQPKKYDIILYTNESMRQYVLAFRGLDIELLIDLFREDKNPLKDKNSVCDMAHSVLTQTYFVYSVAKKIYELSRSRKFTLSFTGYALGAWLAEQSAFFYLNEYQSLDVRAVTFDNPGSLEIFNELKKVLKIENKLKLNDLIKALDIKTYLLYPNFVNTCNKHVGRVFHIYEDSSMSKNHGIENFVSNVVVKEAIKNWYEKSVRPDLFKYKFFINGLRALFQDDLKWLLNEFKQNESTLKEVIEWPKLDMIAKSNDFRKIESNSKMMIDEFTPDNEANSMIGAFARQYVSSLILIGNVLVRIRKGEIREEQCLEGFRYDPILDIFLYDERELKIVDKSDFALIYRDIYRVSDVNSKLDMLCTELFHVDNSIWDFYTGKDETIATSKLGEQFDHLKKLFTIETKMHGFIQERIIESKQVEIESIRERFARLLEISKIYQNKS